MAMTERLESYYDMIGNGYIRDETSTLHKVLSEMFDKPLTLVDSQIDDLVEVQSVTGCNYDEWHRTWSPLFGYQNRQARPTLMRGGSLIGIAETLMAQFNKTDKHVVGITDNGSQYACAGSTFEHIENDNIKIIEQSPERVYIDAGDEIELFVEAEGTGIAHQWQYLLYNSSDWVNSSGSTGASFFASPTTTEMTTQAIQYRCKLTNGTDVVYTKPTSVRLTGSDTNAIIVNRHPQDFNTEESYMITVDAEGSNLRYKWQYKTPTGTAWSDVSNANQLGAIIYGNLTARMMRRCIITDDDGNTYTTNIAILSLVDSTHPKTHVDYGTLAIVKVADTSYCTVPAYVSSQTQVRFNQPQGGLGGNFMVEAIILMEYDSGYSPSVLQTKWQQLLTPIINKYKTAGTELTLSFTILEV